jgi:CubicO group peptidase (beta-lactamase class C family)
MKNLLLTALLITLFCVSGSAQKSEPTPESSSFAAGLDAYFHEQSKNGFSGAVLVVKNKKIVLDKTYGSVAALERDPVFWIASNSKSFVAAAILKLQEKGKLTVNDPLTKFFKDVPEDKRQITVHQLLTHTSGLPHRYAADGETDRDKAVNKILALPLGWKIGEGFHYSNDGYSLLAAIVEVASNRPFEDYLRAEILKPAGLKETGFWGFEEKTALAPAGGRRGPESVGANIYQNGRSVANWGYRGASGLFSTTGDLYRWMLALKQNKIFDTATREQIWGKQILMNKISETEEQFYGYGWMSSYRDGEKISVRHGGFEDWLGHSGVMALYENGDAYVVLSNSGMSGQTSYGTFASREIQKRLQLSNNNKK